MSSNNRGGATAADGTSAGAAAEAPAESEQHEVIVPAEEKKSSSKKKATIKQPPQPTFVSKRKQARTEAAKIQDEESSANVAGHLKSVETALSSMRSLNQLQRARIKGEGGEGADASSRKTVLPAELGSIYGP